MVGNFIHLFALYFFFTIISIVIAAISGLGQVLGLSGFGTGIFQMLFIFVACFSAFKFTHKSSSFFQAKNQVSYTSFNEAGVTKAGAYGKGKIDD
jgi:hypothetical protein